MSSETPITNCYKPFRVVNMLTPKQERFCVEYLRESNASEAYRRSYKAENMSPKTVNEAASRLLDNSKVVARINELRKASGVTVESITAELEEARALGKAEKQAAAMVSATVAKAKLAGLLSDQPSVVVNNQPVTEAAPDLASLRAQVQRSNGREQDSPASHNRDSQLTH